MSLLSPFLGYTEQPHQIDNQPYPAVTHNGGTGNALSLPQMLSKRLDHYLFLTQEAINIQTELLLGQPDYDNIRFL